MRLIVRPPECDVVRALRIEVGDWRAHEVTEIEANVTQTIYYDRMPAGKHTLRVLWVFADGRTEFVRRDLCFIGGDETCDATFQ